MSFLLATAAPLNALAQEERPVPPNIALIFNAMGGSIVDADNGSFESTLAISGQVVQVGFRGSRSLEKWGIRAIASLKWDVEPAGIFRCFPRKN